MIERLIAKPMLLPCGFVVKKASKIQSAFSAGKVHQYLLSLHPDCVILGRFPARSMRMEIANRLASPWSTRYSECKNLRGGATVIDSGYAVKVICWP
jgi:hypothetical protein